MNCTQADAFIQAGVDGRLSAAERTRLDTHLARCAACRAAWDDYRRLSQAASAWTQRAMASEESDGLFTAQVLARIAESQASEPPRPVWPAYASAALAGLTLTALSLWAGSRLPVFPPSHAIADLLSFHSLFSPDSLWPALGRVPQDALELWTALSAHPVILPGWVWSAFGVALGANILFARQARQADQEAAAR